MKDNASLMCKETYSKGDPQASSNNVVMLDIDMTESNIVRIVKQATKSDTHLIISNIIHYVHDDDEDDDYLLLVL